MDTIAISLIHQVTSIKTKDDKYMTVWKCVLFYQTQKFLNYVYVEFTRDIRIPLVKTRLFYCKNISLCPIKTSFQSVFGDSRQLLRPMVWCPMWFWSHDTWALHKNWSFPFRISLVNVTKPVVSYSLLYKLLH